MLETLKIAYPWKALEPPEVRLYTEELCEYGAQELEQAARTHLRASTRYPSVAELLQLLDQARQRVRRYDPPRLEGPRVTQPEARAAIARMLDGWGGSSRRPDRQPGDDDPEAA